MIINEKWSIGKSAILTDLGMCINHYRLNTVGLFACIRVEVKINNQLLAPDMIVAINSGKRKQCEPDFENNRFIGPPNFVLDINDNMELIKERKNLLASAGVEEYLIINEELTKIEWNRLEGNSFKKIAPDKQGIIKSSSLPGLWMSISALRNRDFWTIKACIDHGLTRREHHELMNSIWKKK